MSPFSVVIDSQISEVAKMLYQQGLTELIHSSPSEQVAYLLVERASLMETSEDPNNLTGDGNTARPLGTEAQVLNTSAHQVRGPLFLIFNTHTFLCGQRTYSIIL